MAKHQVVDELAMVGLLPPFRPASRAAAEPATRRAPTDPPPAFDLILNDFDPAQAPGCGTGRAAVADPRRG